ncbi:hypothetical protein DM01DRAFT_1287846 [Hesseltinella vesiculosa]|uniref:Elongation factor 1-beta n=1 Tax=Hesseltinella vesiculosa TaxID=101127 RepID=A0A1X2GH33_9FUNG|nr:hypothetical protein DM01DRAFT_1287846 [Hesseltinella vesiculosa]
MSVSLPSALAYKILNGFFENASYVRGVEASECDKALFESLTEGVNAQDYPHLARWYKHIAAVQGLTAKAAPASAPAAAAEEDDEDVDLFGSDDEVDEAAEQLKAQRIAEYNAKKAAKPKPIAKTTVSIEVKPWDDETDLEAMTAAVKGITMDGLLWGGSQLIPIGFGIKKLLVNCVVEDDKVLLDDLTEQIEALEDFVQSVDIAAMQKI